MEKVLYIRFLAVAALLAACLTGCVHEDADDGKGSVDPADIDTYITLNVDTRATSTRAVSSDGQDGDDFMIGEGPEESIDDIAFFLFHINSWDADGSARYVYRGRLGNADMEWNPIENSKGVSLTIKLKGYVPTPQDRVIVVANTGNKLDNVETLGQLRDFVDFEAWRKGSDPSACDHFVLSSSYNDADNGKVEYQGKAGTKTDPYISGVKVQRVAARIDFLYAPGNVTGQAPFSSFDYKVNENPGDETSALLARLRILSIIPLNVRQGSSYLIRRVTAKGDVYGTGGVSYGGREYRDDEGIPVNTVIEPQTLMKGVPRDGVVSDDLDGWFGDTRADRVFASPASYLTGTAVSDYSQHVLEQDGQKFVIVAYANENTQPITTSDGRTSLYTSKYMTGVLLRAVYVPVKVWADAAATVPSAQDFTSGHTFWRFVPSTSRGESDCIYFDNEAAANAYKTAHAGEVTKFTDGICYYTLWMRHAAVSQSMGRNYPMEYAIVRNNVYRIEVGYVTGPGTPSPSPDEPANALMRIYVRQWNKRVQPTIRL